MYSLSSLKIKGLLKRHLLFGKNFRDKWVRILPISFGQQFFQFF